MVPLTGYTDRLSAAPGERIAFKVSSAASSPYRASLERVVHADPNPAGPGLKIEDLSHRFAIERPSRVLTAEAMAGRFHGNDERIDVESLALTTQAWLEVCELFLA